MFRTYCLFCIPKKSSKMAFVFSQYCLFAYTPTVGHEILRRVCTFSLLKNSVFCLRTRKSTLSEKGASERERKSGALVPTVVARLCVLHAGCIQQTQGCATPTAVPPPPTTKKMVLQKKRQTSATIEAVFFPAKLVSG